MPWVAIITYKKPLIVVDFGTATTFDVVDQGGNYIGGAIAPGIVLSVEILHSATAMLPRIVVERPARVIGKKYDRGDAIGHLLGLCRVGGGHGEAHHRWNSAARLMSWQPAAWRPCSTAQTPVISPSRSRHHHAWSGRNLPP